MKKNIIIALLLVLASSFLLFRNYNAYKQSKDLNKENFKLIYNTFEMKFIYYDINNLKSAYNYIKKKDDTNKNYITKDYYMSEKSGDIEYSFRTPSKYYTQGSLNDLNNFKILKNIDGYIEKVYELKENEADGLFPYTSNDDRVFFLKTYSKKEPYSIICEFKDGNLIEYKNSKGALTKAVVYNDLIYYSNYNDESNLHDIYTIDYNDYNAKPVLFKKDIESSDMYVLNDKIYFSNNKYIYSGEDKFEKASTNYYDISSNTLIQLDGAEDTLRLKIIDAKTKKNLKEIKNVYGLIFDKSGFVIYGDGFIEEIDLKNLKVK